MDVINVKIDRGFELNKKRLAEDYVDVCFIVDGEKFPAHRMMVAMQSDYLKTLTDPSSNFVERYFIS